MAIKIVLSPKLPAPLVEIARSVMPAGYDLHVSDQGTADFFRQLRRLAFDEFDMNLDGRE